MVNFEPKVTTNKALGTFKQLLATLCLGPMTMGAFAGWTSPVLPQFQNENSTTILHLTVEEGSWVGSMLAMGALTCAIPAGFLADRFGPKKCLIGFAIPTVIFGVLVIFTNNVYAFCVGRMFSGFAMGGISVCGPIYISEIADVSLRGTLSSFFELLIYTGIILTAICGTYVDYITLTSIICVFTLLTTFTFFFMPESPFYLIKIKKRDAAEKALRFYRTETNFNAEEVLNNIYDARFNSAQHKSGTSLIEQFKSRAAIRGLIASIGLTIFQQLSGIDGIIFYTVQIFETANSVVLDAYTCAILMAAVQSLSALFLMIIVEKTGRKNFLYMSSVGTCVSLAVFAVYFTLTEYNIDFYGIAALPLASMTVYNFSFALGLGPVPWLINGELFAPEIKGISNGITIATNWSFLFLVTKTMPIMILNWGPSYTFYLFSLFMVMCTVFIKFCVPETRGKTLEQIQQELSS